MKQTNLDNHKIHFLRIQVFKSKPTSAKISLSKVDKIPVTDRFFTFFAGKIKRIKEDLSIRWIVVQAYRPEQSITTKETALLREYKDLLQALDNGKRLS